MKSKLTTVSLPSANMMAITAALLNQQARTEDPQLHKAIRTCMATMPPLFKTVEVKNYDAGGVALQIKCPVTKKVLREKGDEEHYTVTFQNSAACLAEWDDVELDCAVMLDPALNVPWEKFLENSPAYDNYEDMIRKFVIVNYDLFAGRALILAITENMGGGCGGCHSIESYSLLDANPKGRAPMPMTNDCPNRAVSVAARKFEKSLRVHHSMGAVMDKFDKTSLRLHKMEIDRFIALVLKKRAPRPSRRKTIVK